MTCTVLICDDDIDVCVQWVKAVRAVAPPERYDVAEAPGRDDLQDAIQELFARQSALLAGHRRERSRCLFDGVDILILDYDLLHIDERNARHTGESLARLVRVCTTAGVVLIVNQFDAHFDLSLRGHLSSHADLNLQGDLLGSSGLWTDPPWEGFRPWHWQTLHRAVETQRTRQQLVAEHFNEPVVDVLGMREEDHLCLSDTAVGFIAPDARDWAATRKHTFASFVASLGNGKCMSALLKVDEEAACRFAASRIGKWLERRVLGPQNVLIDLPHLIQRFPFLWEDDLQNPAIWTAAVCGAEPAKRGIPESCWFEPTAFLSRPAIWSSRLLEQAGIRETRASFDYARVPPFVFLEDTSAFEQLQEATQFRAGHHNGYDRRFAKCVAGKVYAPQRRLAFVE